MSRIGDIRAVIVDHGGNPNFTYYADGPSSNMRGQKGTRPRTKNVIYKIERYSDGLTRKEREKCIPDLMKIPGVEKVYISKQYTSYVVGGHLKIVFSSVASAIPKIAPNIPVVTPTVIPTLSAEDKAALVDVRTNPTFTLDESASMYAGVSKNVATPTQTTSDLSNFVKEFGTFKAESAFAKFVIEMMAESVVLVCEDDPTQPIPNSQDVANMAKDYANDIIENFHVGVLEQIDELILKNPVKFEAKRTIKVHIKFN
jgi:hypothetical protein